MSVTKKPRGTAEINIRELTYKQFQELCKLVGEDSHEMIAPDVEPILAVYSSDRDLTVFRYTKMRQVTGNQLGRILGITTGDTEGPVSSRRNDGTDRWEGPM